MTITLCCYSPEVKATLILKGLGHATLGNFV